MKQAHLDLLTLFLAEVLATGFLMFLGCGGCLDIWYDTPTSHFTKCLNFGLVVMIIINIFGCVSGAHLNPAVTLAAVVYKLLPIKTAVVYVIGQCLGSFLGYGLLRVVTPKLTDRNFCLSLPSVPTFEALCIEFIITTVLILICCGVWDPRNASHHDSVPLRFGLAVTCLAFVGGPYSGGSMNPARSFGPALYTGNWDYQWIYWLAPLSAALLTSVAFKLIFFKEAPKQIRQVEEIPLHDNKNNV